MADEVVPIHGEYLVEARTARRAALVLARLALGRPRMIVLLIVLVVLSLFFLLIGATNSAGTPIAIAVIGLAAAIGGPLLNIWQARAATSKLFPAGSTVGIGFAPDRIRLKNAQADTTFDPRIFRGIRRVGDFIVMLGAGRSVVLIPKSLVPPDWFAYLQTQVGWPGR